MELHAYLVTYDISDPKRWKKVYECMKNFGEHLQLSVFHCDLTPQRHVRLKASLESLVHHEEDQVLIVKLGKSRPALNELIEVIGRPGRIELPGPKIV